MLKIILLIAVLTLLTFHAANGQEYAVEPIDSAPEAEGVSEEIAELISDQGFRVKKGSSRTVCDIWLCKDLAIDPDFKPTPERLYPFSPGQLIGVVHFGRRGSEFRDQTDFQRLVHATIRFAAGRRQPRGNLADTRLPVVG